MISAQNDKEIIDVLHARNKQEMNTLQHRYEVRITELLEGHMKEIQETKTTTITMAVRKMERILVLELEKMCQAILSKSREEAMKKNESANQIIHELVQDLTVDGSTAKSLDRIKKKLNEVLIKYKQKVDSKEKLRMEQEIIKIHKKIQADFDEKVKEIELRRYDSPSFLDTGIEHDSPNKIVRPSVSNKEFSDFTKEFKLCDKKVYEQNILTRVCPTETEKSIIVDLQRVVSDLKMIKNSFFASARQIGFELVEPHKIKEDFQEQKSPNIPEPVYNISQQYRHLLNTFLRFSRDIVMNMNGEEDTRCFKLENDNVNVKKQEIMQYKLKISDLKEKVFTLQKEQKLLQAIYQNHLDSRLQIIDFNDYDTNKMNDFTKE